MGSKKWLNLLLWGLGERLEGRNNYMSDLLVVINAMTWLSLFLLPVLLPTLGFGGLLLVWVAFPVFGPIYWVGTQVIIGYVIVRKAGRGLRTDVPFAQ